MFVQQPDVALFFALFAGAYFVFLLWKHQGFKLLQWLKVLLPAAVVAFLFAVGPLLSGYELHVKGTAQMQEKNPEQKWNYVTQWSVPPNEVVDFVAPGYYGLRSGEPEGPYWGRMGRSPGWEKTKQGFQNFKLESTYIGIIPLGFALFALFACHRSKHKTEILFWAGAAAMALLLSFGKYFPLYALFYKLPVVNNIRNPNKFIQVFQVCAAILAAYGFNALWRSKDDGDDRCGLEKPIRTFFWSVVALLVVLGLWALVATLFKESGVDRYVSEGWAQQAAQTIVQNKVVSLWHAVFMTAVVVIVFAGFTFPRFSRVAGFCNSITTLVVLGFVSVVMAIAVTGETAFGVSVGDYVIIKAAVAALIAVFLWKGITAIAGYRNALAAMLVLVVAVDAIKLSRHYLKEMPRSYIEANVLTDFLHENLGDQRVALLSQDGINNIWITYLFPYNRISCFNFTDMPRMANDYKELLTVGQRNPLNMWRLSAVKFLLAPSSMEKQLSAAGCRKVFAYGLAQARGQEFKVVAHPNGPFAVYELQGSLPRYALFAGSRKGSDQEVLNGAVSDLNKVYLVEDSKLPVLDSQGQTGRIDVESSRPGRARLKVSADTACILRVAEKYNPAWKAKIDGESVEVERVDYLCQGIAIPAGDHEVVLRYSPSRLYFNLQLLGCAILVGALLMVWRRRNAADVED